MEKHVDTIGTVAAAGGTAGGLVVWGLSLPDWAAMVSIVVALAGFALHVWATTRKDRRAEELHRLSVEELRDESGVRRHVD